MIVKALSAVTYRIQSEQPQRCGRRRQRMVVHFNRLKPYQASLEVYRDRTTESSSSSQPSTPDRGQIMEELDSDDEMVIITDDSQEPDGQEQAPHLQDRGGDCRGGRFRRTVHATRPQLISKSTYRTRGRVLSRRESCVARTLEHIQQYRHQTN